MLVDEATRHEVHTQLEELLGPRLAGTLMSMLPPFTWDQVVTKEYLDLRLEALEHRLGERIEKTTAAQIRWYVGSVVTLTLAMIGSNYALVSALR